MIFSKSAHSFDLCTPDAARRLLRTFFRIARRWRLTADQEMLILGVSQLTCSSWRRGIVTAGLDTSTLERLSYVTRIFASLQILLPIPDRADSWLLAPNRAPLFNGGTALQKMLGESIDGLKATADYLEAELGFECQFPLPQQPSSTGE